MINDAHIESGLRSVKASSDSNLFADHEPEEEEGSELAEQREGTGFGDLMEGSELVEYDTNASRPGDSFVLNGRLRYYDYRSLRVFQLVFSILSSGIPYVTPTNERHS